MVGPLALLFLSGSLALGGVQDRTDTRTAAESAKAFTLDLGALPVDDTVTASSEPAAEPAPAVPPAKPAVASAFSLDTPIADLIADRRAKAVLDRTLPGLSDDPNLPKFRAMSLRQFQPLTGGQLDDALLAKAGAELTAIGDAPAAKSTRRMQGR